MSGILNAIYDKINKKKLKYQVFNTSDANFLAPSDVCFVTASAGGGGGGVSGVGGASGAACEMVPYFTTKGAAMPVTIGAGGAIAGIGGTTTIGAQISLPGGKSGGNGILALGGLRSYQASSLGNMLPTMSIPDAHSIGNYITGADTFYFSASVYGSGNSRYPSGGNMQGAGGYFGAGGNNVAAGNNTGAGGGINSAGGSGKAIIFWED